MWQFNYLTLHSLINQQLIFSSSMLICSVKEDEHSQALSQSKVLIGSALLVVSFIVIILIIGYFNGDSSDGGGSNIATIPSMENIAIEDIIPDIDTDWAGFDDGAGVFPRNRFNMNNIDIEMVETVENVNSALETLNGINI